MTATVPVPEELSDIDQLVAYAVDLQLRYERPALEKLLARLGSLKLAKAKLRDRRQRIGQQIERAHEDRALDEFTRRAGIRHARRAAIARAERAQRRAQRPMLERLQDAFRTARMLPGLSTPDFIGGGDGGESNRVLPAGGDSELYDHYEQLLEVMTCAFERELDRAQYNGEPETAEQRATRIVSHYAGLPAHVVAALDRTVGSPDTVERARDRAGVRRRDGRPHQDREAAA